MGLALTANAQRHLHRVNVSYDSAILGRYIVDLSTIELSACLDEASVRCARIPSDVFIEMPDRYIGTVLN